MVAVIVMTTESMLLEVPITLFGESTSLGRGVVAVIEDAAVVIVLHDESLEDERKVEVAWDDTLSCSHDSRNAIM